MNKSTLVITCPDRIGLVASISGFLYRNNANILNADQHRDTETGQFLMRVEWDPKESDLADKVLFEREFTPLANQLSMSWTLTHSEEKPKVAILVSQYDHCLADLLYRHQAGELNCEIALVISNHPNCLEISKFYQIPYFEMDTHSNSTSEKLKREEMQIELLKTHRVDLVILARYMQILSESFVSLYPNRIINIHHSFLPAFQGARPYHQAYARGVKIIGATSHYVTPVLDEGPIIHQDIMKINHRDQVSDLVQKGRDLETNVLSRAVKWHLENRIVVCGNKTIVLI